MAKVITAELRADISKFQSSVEQASTTVKGFDRTVSQVNNELKKFGNDFAGANIIRQANLAAKAVEDIGGVTRLTTAEQGKLARSVDQALEKYQALGQEVPPRLSAIADELKKVKTATDDAGKGGGLIASGLKSIGPAVAGAFSVGAVVAFGKSIVDAAGEINDMAARTGLGVEQVQEFKYAFEQTGATLEDFQKASDSLSDKLASGDKSALGALNKLGLSARELLALDPATRFEAVADAIGKVGSAAERTELTKDLLKTTAVLPAIEEGLGKLRDQAHEMGQVIREEDIKALDDFGDLVGVITTKVKVELVTAFFDVKRAVSDIASDLKNVGGGVDSLIPKSVQDFIKSPEFQRFLSLAQSGSNVVGALAVDLPKAGLGYLRDRGAAARQADQVDPEIAAMQRQADENVAAFGKAKTAAGDYRAELKALGEELGKLSKAEKQQIDAAKETNHSSEEIANSLNAQHAGLKLTADAIDLYVKRQKEAAEAAKHGFVADLNKATTEAHTLAVELERLGGVTKLDAQQRAAANKTLYEGVQAYRTLGQAATPAARQVERLFAATSDIKETGLAAGNSLDGLLRVIQKMNDPTIEPWKRFFEVIQPKGFTVEGLQNTLNLLPKLSTDAAKEWAKDVAQAKDELKKSSDETQAWTSAIGNVAGAFATLAQVSGGTLDGMIGQIAKVVGLMNAGAQAGAGLRAVFGQGNFGQAGNLGLAGFRNSEGNFTAGSVANGSAAAFAQGASAVGALDQATNVKGRGRRALQGAATGASIGNSIVPGYGALVGAAVGALIGAFRNPAFEDVYKRVAKNFGIELSDETAKAIASIAKTTFKGDRQSAEIFSLDKIIAEGGGIKQGTLDKLTDRLRDAFILKDQGKFTADQLTEVLEKNYGSFTDFVLKSNTIASQGFSDIAKLAKQAGVDVAGVTDFVRGQTSRVGGGLSALAGPLSDVAGLKEQAKAAEEAQRKAAEAVNAARGGKSEADLGVGDREAVAAAEKARAQAGLDLAAINEKIAAGSKDAQAEFDRLGTIALGAFNAARASGLGFLDAVDQLSPGLDKLKTIEDSLGLSGNAAFEELSHFRDLVNNNDTLVASAEALNETILGLSNIGGLTTDTLKALEDQGLSTFGKLTDAGFTTNQAIEIQRGFLENLEKAHEQLGIPIDENTQKLIDQSKALEGLKPKDTLSVMESGFKSVVSAVDRLTVALGGEVPAAASAAASAVTGLADTTEEQVGHRMGSAITGCFTPVSQLTKDAAADVSAMSDDMRRNLQTKVKESADEFARSIGIEIPAAAQDGGDAIVTELGDATKVWLEGSSSELREFIKKLNTALPEAADAAGRAIREKIPSRIPVDVELTYTDKNSPAHDQRERGDGSTGDGNRAAGGAIVYPSPGGTKVTVAEAGDAELIAPLKNLPTILPSSARGSQPIVVYATGQVDRDVLLRIVARGIPDYTRTFGGLQ